MRAGLALIALLALSVTPAVAQGKTKTPPPPGALVTLEVCELFASGVPDAVEQAEAMDWEVTPGDPETPWVTSTNIYRQVAGLGYVEGFILMEDYPGLDFGYCRIDVYEREGEADVALIDDLPRWQGAIKTEGSGTFGSWKSTGGDDQRLLLSHEDEYGFVLQLTVMRPKADEAGEG